MATQTSALLKGFDYQHLISWYQILSLKISRYFVTKVKLEDSQAGLVDDVTVFMGNTVSEINFYQIKYHVDQRDSYNIDKLLDDSTGTSLMEKFWSTWKSIKKLYPSGEEKIKLNLYTNWLIDHNDEILTCVCGESGSLNDTFYNSSKKSSIGKKREAWRLKHQASEEEFIEFTKSLVFHLGKDFSDELKRMISERMELLKLKHDENALLVSAGIVKDWIKTKTQEITLDILEDKLKHHNLYLPTDAEKFSTVYFITVKDHKFDLEPDYILDWRDSFQKTSNKGDHTLLNVDDWNKKLLPELYEFEKRINNETSTQFIRARGYARLSPWFAFGFVFSEVSGYKIEVNQQGNLWRTDASMNKNFNIINENNAGETISTNTNSVAVGISITGSLCSDVRKYFNTNKIIDSLLFIRPEKELGKDCLTEAADVIAFAVKTKEKIRDFVKQHNAEKLFLFYFGPLSGACFLGHQLNAVCKEIQIMENIPNGYTPSFLLK